VEEQARLTPVVRDAVEAPPLSRITLDPISREFRLATIAKASEDNVITKDEARDIRRRWEELKSVTEGFVHSAEDGNFARLHEKTPAKE